VDFIPLANMCPKPITGNFFGYSLGERLVPMQEYATAIRRAEMSFAMQSSTPRIGVNPEFLDAEEIQRGVSAMFILDRKFDPTKHVFEFQPMQGNLGYVESAMTSPTDTMNPEVMKDGNSGFKLQLAMGPNQLIQDEMVKNCAIGLRDAIYIMWKTLIQYSDDYNIQQLAGTCLKGAPFMDAVSVENFEFIDRKMINIDLALGFLSEENRLTRHEMFIKVRRPFEDTLRVLGVKDVDAYLPTFEEAAKIIQASMSKGPSPEQQEMQSKVALNNAKVQESGSVTALNIKKAEDIDMDNYYEGLAAKRGKLSAVQID
jgi:hypothetical protein